MSLQEYECPACGGAMEFNPTTQKLKCLYCDSEFDVKDARFSYMLYIFNIKNPSFTEDDVFEILSSIKQNS